MSADWPIPTTQQMNSGAAASEIEDFFKGVEPRSRQEPRLHGESGTCQFDISGMGSWLFSIKNGMPTLVRDRAGVAA
jgi:hypothetical protein